MPTPVLNLDMQLRSYLGAVHLTKGDDNDQDITNPRYLCANLGHDVSHQGATEKS